MNDSLRTGTKLLTAAFIVAIVGTVINALIPYSIHFFLNYSRNFFVWHSYLNLALSVSGAGLLIGGWSLLRNIAPPRALPFLNAALAFPILKLMLSVVSRVAPLRMLAMPLWVLAFFGGSLAAWLALRALAADRLPKPADASSLFITALVIGVVISGYEEWAVAKDHSLAYSSTIFTAMSFVDHLVSLFVDGLLLSRTRALAASMNASDPAAADVAEPILSGPPPGSSGNDLVVGSIWLVGGLAVTIGSFAVASGGSGGGHYFVTTGAIAYGLARVIRGLTRR